MYINIDQDGYNDGLIVIGAGLPRTGTTSQTDALSYLLDGSCFHGSRLPSLTEEELDFWLRAFGKSSLPKPSPEEWRDFFKNEKACLDLPAIFVYKDLMLAFPRVRT